ncbi:MAG TPA: hypothetical protein VNO30_17845 [Kofleriaceae bacterium]|nr:hypothetical protein [Kofleriaceae bacterium]
MRRAAPRAWGRLGLGLALALALASASSPAAAEPAAPPALQVVREPPPRHLRIRPRAAQVAAPAQPAAPRTPMPAAPDVSATSPERIEGLEGLRDVLQPISFSINLGYQVDGARRSGRDALGALAPTETDFVSLRGFGFGEAFVSTRGLIVPSLATYFSARFQAARRLPLDQPAGEPPLPEQPRAPPIATWFERSGLELRTGWAEVKDFLPQRWGLANLRVRGGDQFIYGPWIVHLTGLHVAYEGPTLTMAAYGGQRRADYQRDLEDSQPIAIGASFKVDLRGLTTKVPLAFGGEYLKLTASDASSQPATESALLQVDWRPRQDFVVIAQQRWLAGELASQHLEVRTRYKDVTNVVFEVMRRLPSDWRWDPTLVERSPPITEARRYLDLGPVVSQVLFSARGGTLIAENLDLFARVAAAPQLGSNNPMDVSYAAPYLELAGALEGRIRRQISVGVSVLSRDTNRPEATAIVDAPGSSQPLPPSGRLGEEVFFEAGATVRMTLGARRFSALMELYGRRTHYTDAYEDPVLALPERDLRGGGRFTVDAWIGKRLRLFASYDVSSELATAPEINGYKSLRLVMTGVY